MFSPIMPALIQRARGWGLQRRPAGDNSAARPVTRPSRCRRCGW